MSTMIMNDEQIMLDGMEALRKRLGPAGAARFLGIQPREPVDYVSASRRFYKNETVKSIVARVRSRKIHPAKTGKT